MKQTIKSPNRISKTPSHYNNKNNSIYNPKDKNKNASDLNMNIYYDEEGQYNGYNYDDWNYNPYYNDYNNDYNYNNGYDDYNNNYNYDKDYDYNNNYNDGYNYNYNGEYDYNYDYNYNYKENNNENNNDSNKSYSKPKKNERKVSSYSQEKRNDKKDDKDPRTKFKNSKVLLGKSVPFYNGYNFKDGYKITDLEKINYTTNNSYLGNSNYNDNNMDNYNNDNNDNYNDNNNDYNYSNNNNDLYNENYTYNNDSLKNYNTFNNNDSYNKDSNKDYYDNHKNYNNNYDENNYYNNNNYDEDNYYNNNNYDKKYYNQTTFNKKEYIKKSYSKENRNTDIKDNIKRKLHLNNVSEHSKIPEPRLKIYFNNENKNTINSYKISKISETRKNLTKQISKNNSKNDKKKHKTLIGSKLTNNLTINTKFLNQKEYRTLNKSQDFIQNKLNNSKNNNIKITNRRQNKNFQNNNTNNINSISKRNINKKVEISRKRNHITYVTLAVQKKTTDYIPNYNTLGSITSRYNHTYKSNTNFYEDKKNHTNINNHQDGNEANEPIKLDNVMIYPNNIIIDITKDHPKETIFSSSQNRILNFKKNLLDSIPKKDCELCHKPIYSHLYKFHYNSHATEIFKWLYLGTFDNASDVKELRRIKATHVLNCAIECTNNNLPRNIKELHLKIHDYEGFELFDYFERANEFMNKCKLSGGAILVHCKYGISRSAAFVIAYLIKYMRYTTDSALKFLIQKRNQTKPNEGFMEQLYNYEIWIKRKKR